MAENNDRDAVVTAVAGASVLLFLMGIGLLAVWNSATEMSMGQVKETGGVSSASVSNTARRMKKPVSRPSPSWHSQVDWRAVYEEKDARKQRRFDEYRDRQRQLERKRMLDDQLRQNEQLRYAGRIDVYEQRYRDKVARELWGR